MVWFNKPLAGLTTGLTVVKVSRFFFYIFFSPADKHMNEPQGSPYFRTALNVGSLKLCSICLNCNSEGKRTKAALEPIIIKHVARGTTILTDGWSAYKDLEKHGINYVCLA